MMERFEVSTGGMTFTGRAGGPEDGRLVILLHGFPQSSFEWRHQIAALAEEGYRAVAPDQRGYSEGARPEAVDAYGMDHLVADVLAIADDMGGHRFDLVGHDWGAAVAWQVAGRYPDRVRTLTPVSVPHPRAFAGALRNAAGDQAQRSSYMDFFRSEGSEDLMTAGGGAGLRNLFASSGLTDVDEYVDLLLKPGAMRAALNWYRAASIESVEAMGPITMPTMYVWSTDDQALGREGAEATAQFVEGPYRFEVLEGISHWVPELAPERLNDVLLDFLSSNPA